jgi:hypothetical protein
VYPGVDHRGAEHRDHGVQADRGPHRVRRQGQHRKVAAPRRFAGRAAHRREHERHGQRAERRDQQAQREVVVDPRPVQRPQQQDRPGWMSPGGHRELAGPVGEVRDEVERIVADRRQVGQVLVG